VTPVAGDGSPERFGFPRQRRLTRGAELDVVRREGKRLRTEHLEVRVLASLSTFGVSRPPAAADSAAADSAAAPGPARVGLVVPKHRQTAVARNRVKRRLRELARTRLLPALDALGPATRDAALVLRAAPQAYAATFDALARDVERVGREAARVLLRGPAAREARGAAE
jgi:ribonuclease P protein component